MKQTTLCYLIKDNKMLMMHRTKKRNDPNHHKWIGIGGKIEKDEGIEDAMKREVFEETGYVIHAFQYHGVIFFHSDVYESETMHLFSSHDFSGQMIDSIEGTLKWVHINKVFDLNLWEGDMLFLRYMLEDKPFFHLTLYYEKDHLASHHITYPSHV